MKNSRKVILATLLAFVMLFSSFAVLNVSATPDDDDVEPIANLYYFNDYYPTVPKSQMDEEYPDISSVYDHKWIDGEDFDIMVANNYFESIADESIVVIDIKAFLPNTSTLYNLFSSLKDRGCMTIFVTIYDEEAYDDTSFMDYVDEYVVSEFQRLRNFLHLHFEWVKDTNLQFGADEYSPLQNTVFFIDGRLINDEEYSGDVEYLCTDSPFLRIMLEELAEKCNIVTSGTSHEDLFGALYDEGIRIIAHVGPDEYLHLGSGTIYETSSLQELYSNDILSSSYVSAIGFSHLESNFYNFLDVGQEYVRRQLSSDLPVGIMEVEPFVPGTPSLDFLTDRDLVALYGEEPYKEWPAFFVALDSEIAEIS